MTWPAIALFALGAYALKAVGVVVLGPRAAAGPALRAASLLPPALFAALVVVQTFGADRALAVDARVTGVAAACVAAWRGAPFWLTVVVAAAVTAAVRAA